MMGENNNVGNLKDCYGCGVCVISCIKNAIKLSINTDGFYYPEIDDNLCVRCGICKKTCSFNHEDILKPSTNRIKGYAGWSLDPAVRETCSSGGVAYELAKSFINIDSNHQAIVVKYDAKTKAARHYLACSESELDVSRGSKYLQSYTVDGFLPLLNRRDDVSYLIFGTPCQIDSIRRYTNLVNIENKVVLVDFFCHGIPSRLIWEKYTKQLESQIGALKDVSWRNKTLGWHNSWIMLAKGENGIVNSPKKDGDCFYGLFLGNNCLGKACYSNCKYKGISSAADIRLGDFWGDTYKNDDKGVSSILALTERGNALLRKTQSLNLIDHEVDCVLQGQLKRPLSYPKCARTILLFMAKRSFTLQQMFFVSRLFNKIKSIIK